MIMAYGKYSVPKVQEQKPKVPGKMGGNADVMMPSPPPVGAQKNPGASPDPMFGREFNAEADLATLLRANAIRANKSRYGAAIALKDRTVAMGLKNRGGEPIGERKGKDNAGIRTRQNNTFDHRAAASKPTNGTKMDGQKSRW
jgi:hypothetical protein